jgi:hypothetical protein
MKKQKFREKEKESTVTNANKNREEKMNNKLDPFLDDYYFIYWR